MCKILKPSYYENFCIASIQILHNNKDHQVLFVGAPNESNMAVGHHFAKKKSINCHISAMARPIISKFGMVMQNDPLTLPTIKNLNF